ncbi:MAG: urea ABC transporter ATP-binding protein UrtD [Oscillospiraceae bacterium]|nr:urea ABC transporter ATP-binding protein UrtD [Oscillospiraceae bacterium]
MAPTLNPEAAPVLLETRGLSVNFNGFQALSDISLSIRQGELRVIIGPNGAGKTTFMDLITAKARPSAGQVLFEGQDITGKSAAEIARRYKIGRKFQGPNVFDNMTVAENIELAIAGYESLPQSLFFRASAAFRHRVTEILEQIELADYRDFMATDLSHGQRQWLEIGMVFAQDPKLIILDEPTSGMTADETKKTGEMIKKLKGEHTILVVEHDMDFVRQVADYVTVFNFGKLLVEGTLEAVQQNPEVQAVYLKEAD